MSATTTGALRTQLTKMMTELDKPNPNIEVIKHKIKAAAQINESLYAEAKIMCLQFRAGQTMNKVGSLSLD